MTDRVRAFVAVPAPGPLLAALLAAQQKILARGLRPTRSDQLHVTLKFLGDVDPQQVAALAREVARGGPALEARLTGITAFPTPRRARVVVAELADEGGEMARFAARLEAAAEAVGIPREQRSFRPHVTLARLREPRSVAVDVAVPDHPACRFERLVLFRSVLASSGPTYTVLAESPLAKR
jgi:RNA 2',3'-cyclic 3'-phosphodiesterase